MQKISDIKKISFSPDKKPVLIPVILSYVSAGFPSPADDYIEKNIDLNESLIKNKLATYLVKVDGNSMNDEIHDGDRLIVDRSLETSNRDVVVAIIEGELIVKRIVLREKRAFLVPENPDYPEIEITGESEFIIWGVATHSIHKLRHD